MLVALGQKLALLEERPYLCPICPPARGRWFPFWSAQRASRRCCACGSCPFPRQRTALLGCAMRNRPALARDRQRTRYSFRNDFERMRKADCSVACYTGLEWCPANSGSIVFSFSPAGPSTEQRGYLFSETSRSPHSLLTRTSPMIPMTTRRTSHVAITV